MWILYSAAAMFVAVLCYDVYTNVGKKSVDESDLGSVW